tara:strand:+ start:586 stop:993 length:408 start_codon:yes stop_codon:yes gene_type:complete
MKNKLFIHPGLEVRKSRIHGYGVFTSKHIKADTVIEECMVPYEVIEPGYEYENGEMFPRNKDVLPHYRFMGPHDQDGVHRFFVTPTGFAMVYNHADDNNVIWHHDTKNRLVLMVTCKDISPEEELYQNYGENFIK